MDGGEEGEGVMCGGTDHKLTSSHATVSALAIAKSSHRRGSIKVRKLD